MKKFPKSMKFRYGLILIISYFQNIFMVTFLITHFYVFSKFETTAKDRPRNPKICPKLAKLFAVHMYIHMKWLNMNIFLSKVKITIKIMVLFIIKKIGKSTAYKKASCGARTRDHTIKSRALYQTELRRH